MESGLEKTACLVWTMWDGFQINTPPLSPSHAFFSVQPWCHDSTQLQLWIFSFPLDPPQLQHNFLGTRNGAHCQWSRRETEFGPSVLMEDWGLLHGCPWGGHQNMEMVWGGPFWEGGIWDAPKPFSRKCTLVNLHSSWVSQDHDSLQIESRVHPSLVGQGWHCLGRSCDGWPSELWGCTGEQRCWMG